MEDIYSEAAILTALVNFLSEARKSKVYSSLGWWTVIGKFKVSFLETTENGFTLCERVCLGTKKIIKYTKQNVPTFYFRFNSVNQVFAVLTSFVPWWWETCYKFKHLENDTKTFDGCEYFDKFALE